MLALVAGFTRSPSRRASVGTSSGIDANSRRYAGQAGMSRRQNEPDSMVARAENPFTTRNAAEPPAEQGRDRAASDAKDGDEPGERRPLREPRAPEELAQLIHLRRQCSKSRSR